MVKSRSALPRRPSLPSPALTVQPAARGVDAHLRPNAFPRTPGVASPMTLRPPRVASALTLRPPEGSLPLHPLKPTAPLGVLIVEGDAVLRHALRRCLRAEGILTAEAATGADASALLERHTFALIVVDEQLPDASGLAWVTGLREAGQRAPAALVAGLCSDVRQLAPAALGLDLRFIVEKRDALHALPSRVLSFFARAASATLRAPAPASEEQTEPPGVRR
ncbi:MAG: response regulator [Polyangiaceae bacterium]|nr:response regulator [Polyangiaceae bacterium]